MIQLKTLKIAAVFGCFFGGGRSHPVEEYFLLGNHKNILAVNANELHSLGCGKRTNYNANSNDDNKHLHNKMITSQ